MNIPFSITQTLPDDTKLDLSQGYFINTYPAEKIIGVPLLPPSVTIPCVRNSTAGPSAGGVVETVGSTQINGYFRNTIRGIGPIGAGSAYTDLGSENIFTLTDTTGAGVSNGLVYTLNGTARFASIGTITPGTIIGKTVVFAPLYFGDNANSSYNVSASTTIRVYLMNSSGALTLCSTLNSPTSSTFSTGNFVQIFPMPAASITSAGVSASSGDRLVIEMQLSGTITITSANGYSAPFIRSSLGVISSINSFMSSRTSYRPIDLYI